MFVKQIDMKEALRLAAGGQEIKVLVPTGPGTGWESLEPDTLQNMLADVLFFRNEPAMDNSEFEQAVETILEAPPPLRNPEIPAWRMGPRWTVVPNGPR